MNKINIGDKVCFLGGQSLPQFFGGVYEVIGQTIYGIFNDEYALADGKKTRRVHIKSIRHATPEEIAAGHRIDQSIIPGSEGKTDSLEVLRDCDVSPNCKVIDQDCGCNHDFEEVTKYGDAHKTYMCTICEFRDEQVK